MSSLLGFFIASAFPVIVFLYLIYSKDRRKEPFSLLIKCFLGGFVVAVLAIIIEMILGIYGDGISGNFFRSLYTAFLVAAGTEELLKWVILKKIVWKHADFDEHYDGIIYAVFVSLGFAFIENLLYVFDGGISVAVGRAVLAVPGHGLDAVIMGYHLSLAKLGAEKDRKYHMVMSIVMPIAFHGAYDFALMYMGTLKQENAVMILMLFLLFSFVVIYSWIVAIRNIKKHLREDGKADANLIN